MIYTSSCMDCGRTSFREEEYMIMEKVYMKFRSEVHMISVYPGRKVTIPGWCSDVHGPSGKNHVQIIPVFPGKVFIILVFPGLCSDVPSPSGMKCIWSQLFWDDAQIFPVLLGRSVFQILIDTICQLYSDNFIWKFLTAGSPSSIIYSISVTNGLCYWGWTKRPFY